MQYGITHITLYDIKNTPTIISTYKTTFDICV